MPSVFLYGLASTPFQVGSNFKLNIMSEIKEAKDFIRGVFEKEKNQSNKQLVVIYVTKKQKEIHRDWNPVYIPVETNLITFKNIDAPHIFGDLKETLFYVANVEYQVPNVVVITLLGQTEA